MATAMQLRALNRSVPTVRGGGAPTVGGEGNADGEYADRVQPEVRISLVYEALSY